MTITPKTFTLLYAQVDAYNELEREYNHWSRKRHDMCDRIDGWRQYNKKMLSIRHKAELLVMDYLAENRYHLYIMPGIAEKTTNCLLCTSKEELKEELNLYSDDDEDDV